jgi:multidrug resistance efflux pump
MSNHDRACPRVEVDKLRAELEQLRRERDAFEELWKTEQGLCIEEQRERDELEVFARAFPMAAALKNENADLRRERDRVTAVLRQNEKAFERVEDATTERIAAWVEKQHPGFAQIRLAHNIRSGAWRKP